MNNASLLVGAMAAQCRATIQEWDGPQRDLPQALRPEHLQWMCNVLEQYAEDWPATRMHRWIGFVQCAMMANGMLDLEGAKAMFDTAKTAHADASDDLADHLDPASSFELDIGGEA